MMEYYGVYPENDYRYYLKHYAKGSQAKDHKYLYIDENGRYIYPEDKTTTEWNRWKANKTVENRVTRPQKKNDKGVRDSFAVYKKLRKRRFDDIGSPSLDYFVRGSKKKKKKLSMDLYKNRYQRFVKDGAVR